MTNKTCTKCKETKSVSGFYKSRSTKDGLQYRCKLCDSEETRRYREANKEKKSEIARRYYEANREQNHRQNAKACREANKRSLELAHRQGQPWEDWEDEFVLSDNGLTMYQKAVKLGRSFEAARSRKAWLRKSARAELTTDTVRV